MMSGTFASHKLVILSKSAKNNVLSLYLAAVEGNVHYQENFYSLRYWKSVHFQGVYKLGGCLQGKYFEQYTFIRINAQELASVQRISLYCGHTSICGDMHL